MSAVMLFRYACRGGYTPLDSMVPKSRFLVALPGPVAATVSAVADVWGVDRGEVLGSDRRRFISDARHAAMWILHNSHGLSFSEIAREFGADHSSVRYAVDKVERLKAEGPGFAGRLWTAIENSGGSK